MRPQSNFAALASTDALTGLKNRREFDRALRTIPRLPFAVLSVDVDRLKEINDSQGHAAGDALLRVVGHTLGLLVRGWDVMARIGGDEFAALLPEVGVFGAQLVAERMRVAMHSLVLPHRSGADHRWMERCAGGSGSSVCLAARRRVAFITPSVQAVIAWQAHRTRAAKRPTSPSGPTRTW